MTDLRHCHLQKKMSTTINPELLDKRNSGCAVEVDGKLYIWGGNGEDTETVEISDSNSESEENSSTPNVVTQTISVDLPRKDDPNFDVYDFKTRTWSRKRTSGCIPALGNGSTLTYHPGTHSMYLFAGWNDGNFSSQIYKISVTDWIWEKITLANSVEPSPRYLTGVVLHKDRLCMFAGVGPPPAVEYDNGARYHAYEVNGEPYSFGTWEAPLSGTEAIRPPPVGAHVFTKFDSHRALYVGGRREEGRVNDYYIFDLDQDQRKFSGPLQPKKKGSPLPTPHTFATLTALVNPDLLLEKPNYQSRQKLLLLWGKHTDQLICNEAWEIDMETFDWQQVNVGSKKPRAWHIACPHYRKPNECQLVVFGGNSHVKGQSGDRENVSDLRILSFGLQSLETMSLSVIVRAIGEVISLVGEVQNLLPASYPSVLQRKICEAFSAHQHYEVERMTQ